MRKRKSAAATPPETSSETAAAPAPEQASDGEPSATSAPEVETVAPEVVSEPFGDGALEATPPEADEMTALDAERTPGDDAPAVESAEGGDAADDEAALPTDASRIESILESLLFATDRPLGVTDLKRLLGERDGKRITAALEGLREKRADSGVQLISVAGGWQLRTHPANGAWVAKLVAGRPQRLSRAMMETLAIVAYRQPITRPEIDEIRGVDCGPVLRTLLDRTLIRVIGKKEEVGRPILYGTTPEFLKTFSLRDLTELPTLRDFHELGVAERAEVDAKLPLPEGTTAAEAGAAATAEAGAPRPPRPSTVELSHVDPGEEEALLEELEEATQAAGRATSLALDPTGETEEEPAGAPADAAPADRGDA